MRRSWSRGERSSDSAPTSGKDSSRERSKLSLASHEHNRVVFNPHVAFTFTYILKNREKIIRINIVSQV